MDYEVTIKGSMIKTTYNLISVNGILLVGVWGKITKVKSQNDGTGKSYVCIDGTDVFVHHVDRVFLGGK